MTDLAVEGEEVLDLKAVGHALGVVMVVMVVRVLGEVLAPDNQITRLVMVVLGLQVMLDLREIQAMLAQLGHQLRLLV